ncbi:MAG: FAD binding domain-containing protein [Chitinophagaceae bacterium]|nr:FAD binding domain-containing protein [Chitinophagaceae bacterium]
MQFILNDKEIETNLPPGMVLLDFIRYRQHLMGTKIGCREGDCGACTVLVGELVNDALHYHTVTSCLMPVGNAEGKHIVTIEGINRPKELNMVQQAMADAGATQCGFCTPGFVMSLAGFCLSDKAPTNENAIASVDGNICRCTGYKSIEKAAIQVAGKLNGKNEPIAFVTEHNILPAYFAGIKERLKHLSGKIITGALKEAAAAKERPHFVGGGTDLYVQKHDEMKDAAIRFLLDHPEYNSIRKEGHKCIIGPSATVSDLQRSAIIRQAFPAFDQYAKLISSTPIRNMATIAGNFINASPIGDLTIFFLALDAQLVLSDGHAQREISLRKLYKGYKQLDKRPDEHIEEIWFDIPGKQAYFNFEKVSKRTHLDIASVNTAICLQLNGNVIEQAGLSAGGVGPVPMYLQSVSDFLTGKTINEKTIQQAIQTAMTEVSPISDARGSKEYKSLLLGQLIKAHFIRCRPELAGE